jgi:PiT family inorganic phosphate transporter
MSLSGSDLPFLALIVVALILDFFNGFQDGGNIISTMVASGAMEPGPALWLAALGEACGPFLFGVAVATTLGSQVVSPAVMTEPAVIAALVGAILWAVFTSFLRLPSSSSHALVGGLVGAAGVSAGLGEIRLAGLGKTLLALFVSPVIGILASYVFLRLVIFLAQRATPRINRFFRLAQIPASLALALSHGSNDGQKTIGIITMGMVASGRLSHFEVPTWVIAMVAGAIALGTLSGGLRIARTLGTRIYRIRPLHGFSAQVTATSIILGASLLGGPVSTTQVVSSAIIGAGASERLSKVRWNVFGTILLTWILTIPAAALLAVGAYSLLRLVGWS